MARRINVLEARSLVASRTATLTTTSTISALRSGTTMPSMKAGW